MATEEKQLHIRMPKDIYKELKIRCVYEDITMQEYVAKLVVESLSKDTNRDQSFKESDPNNKTGKLSHR